MIYLILFSNNFRHIKEISFPVTGLSLTGLILNLCIKRWWNGIVQRVQVFDLFELIWIVYLQGVNRLGIFRLERRKLII
jgi:hypothetical protein